MKKAKTTDKNDVVKILSNSFADNRSVNWVIKKKKNIDKLMSYCFDVCTDSDGTFISEDRKGALLFDLPNSQKHNKFMELINEAFFAITVVGLHRVLKVLKREAYVKKMHPKGEFIYLWFVGVLQDRQQTGVGSKLVKSLIEIAKKEGLPIYLETSNPDNLPFYKKHGFEMFHEWNSPITGFTIWFFKLTV